MKPLTEDSRLIERFDLIVNGPALFNALVAGLELGVFTTLAKGPTDFETLRAAADLAPHQMRVLLTALCATELITFQDGRYANRTAVEPMLCSEGPGNWLAILRGWQQIYYPAFAQTTTAMRAGTNTALDAYPGDGATLYERLARDPEKEAVLHDCMAAFTQQSMSGLLNHIDLAPGSTLLDVGGGDGTTARELAGRFPDVSITVLDLPSVVSLAQTDTGGRISYVGGDVFDDPFPSADAVLFSHCLEVFSPERIQTMLGKAFDALKPGGRLYLYGYTPTEGGLGVYSARLSLYLTVLATGQGMAYPAADYHRWLIQCGFSTVCVTTGLPFEHSLISARRD